MKLSAILAPLIAAKVPHDIIMQTVQAWEAEQQNALEKRRKSDAERQSRKRERDNSHVTSRDVTVTVSSHDAGDARGLDNLQTKNITGQKENKKDSAPKARVDLDAFRDELSPILDPERIEALIAVRRKKGATMTANTGRLLIAAIRRCPMPPADVADEMALRNWISVKPDWLESRTTPPRQATSPPKKITQASMWKDELAAFEMDHEPDFPTDRRLDARLSGGQDQILDFPRRIAGA